MNTYSAFLDRKRRLWTGSGIDTGPVTLPAALYPWQAAIVRWALRNGRAAIFADCGLGKTFMQVAWAQALNVQTLILAPLCVAEQTVAEARKLGVDIHYAQAEWYAAAHNAASRLHGKVDRRITSASVATDRFGDFWKRPKESRLYPDPVVQAAVDDGEAA